MDIFQAVILGIIEGFTEFLPISSTGHLIVASSFLGLPQSDNIKAFEVIIQLSAILAVFSLYKDKFTLKKLNLWKKIITAYLPLAVIGFIFRHQIKELFSLKIVAIMFIVGGIIFLVIEKFYDEKRVTVKDIEKIGYKEALFIGIAQVFALIPGTSRAGSSIVGGLLSGLSRSASAEFSFLLAFPVMLSVSGYDILKHYSEFSSENLTTLLVGFGVSYIVALGSMKFLLSFLSKFTFVSFGIYRIIFGITLLMLF